MSASTFFQLAVPRNAMMRVPADVQPSAHCSACAVRCQALPCSCLLSPLYLQKTDTTSA